jgi:hypothetical protein
MLLVHHARGQGDGCPYSEDGSWDGDEKYMHVHHMTYEHRGYDIRRETRRKYSMEEKIRIVLEGLRGESSVAALCRREGINPNMY